MRSSFLYKARSPPPHSLSTHSLSIQLFERSRPLLLLPAHSSNSNQLQGGELQLPAHLYQGNLLAIQALQTSEQRRDVLQENFKPTTELQSPTEPLRPHYRQRPFHRTTTGAATLFPLFMDGNTTGLNINTHMRLSKTVY